MGRNYTAVPNEYLEELEVLTDEEFGRLVRAMIRYNLTGEEISPVGNERFFVKQVMTIQDRFIKKNKEISEKRRKAGMAGASKRWQMPANDSKQWQMMANDGTLDIYNNNYNNNNISTDNRNNNTDIQKEKKKSKKEKEEYISPGDFEKFWKAYPKKQAKEVARSAFKKVKVPVEVLIEAIEQQKQSRQWTQNGGEFIPLPSTWLNQKRWEDKLEVEVTDKRSEVLAYGGFEGNSSREEFHIPAFTADMD